MLLSLLLEFGALTTVEAFPRWQKRQTSKLDAPELAALAHAIDARDVPACSPVTSYVPIITQIPFCSGNICPTNTIISQGQPVTTFSVLSTSTSGSIGQVLGGTTIINNGAAATNVALSSFTLCESSCSVAGNAYGSGTIYFTTSALVPASTTTVVGGQTLTDSTALISSPTAVTSNFYSTVINGMPVTDGAQPLTTITAGTDGISTTTIQPASQVVASLVESSAQAATNTPSSGVIGNPNGLAGIPGGSVGSSTPDASTLTVIVPANPSPSTAIVVVTTDGNGQVESSTQTPSIATNDNANSVGLGTTEISQGIPGDFTAVVGNPGNAVVRTTANDGQLTSTPSLSVSSNGPTIAQSSPVSADATSFVDFPQSTIVVGGPGGAFDSTSGVAGMQTVDVGFQSSASSAGLAQGNPGNNVVGTPSAAPTSVLPGMTTSSMPAASGLPDIVDRSSVISSIISVSNDFRSSSVQTSSEVPVTSIAALTTSESMIRSKPAQSSVVSPPALPGQGNPGNNAGLISSILTGLLEAGASSAFSAANLGSSSIASAASVILTSIQIPSESTLIISASQTPLPTSTLPGQGNPGNNAGLISSSLTGLLEAGASSAFSADNLGSSSIASAASVILTSIQTTSESTLIISASQTPSPTSTLPGQGNPGNNAGSISVSETLTFAIPGSQTSVAGSSLSNQISSDASLVFSSNTLDFTSSEITTFSPLLSTFISTASANSRDTAEGSTNVIATATATATVSTTIPTTQTTTNSGCVTDQDCALLGLGLCLHLGPLLDTGLGVCLSGPSNLGLSASTSSVSASIAATLPIVTSAPSAVPVTTVQCGTSEECVKLGLGLCLQVSPIAEGSVGLCLQNGPSRSLSSQASRPTASASGSLSVSFSADVSLDLTADRSGTFLSNSLPSATTVPTQISAPAPGLSTVVEQSSIVSIPAETTPVSIMPGGRACSSDLDCSGLGASICFRALNLAAGQVGVCVDPEDPQLLGLSLTASVLPASLGASISLSNVLQPAETAILSLISGLPEATATNGLVSTVVFDVNGVAQTLIGDISSVASEVLNLPQPTEIVSSIIPSVDGAAQTLLQDVSSIISGLESLPTSNGLVSTIVSDVDGAVRTLIGDASSILSDILSLTQPTYSLPTTGGVVRPIESVISGVLPGLGVTLPTIPAPTGQASIIHSPSGVTSFAVSPTDRPCTSDAGCDGLDAQICLKVLNSVAVRTGVCVDPNDPRLLGVSLVASVLPVTLDASVSVSNVLQPLETALTSDILNTDNIPAGATNLEGVVSTVISNTAGTVSNLLGDVLPLTSGFSGMIQPTMIASQVNNVIQPIESAAGAVFSDLDNVASQASTNKIATGVISLEGLPTGRPCTSDIECSGVNAQVCLKVLNLVALNTGICVDPTDPRLLGATLAASAVPVTLDASVSLGNILQPAETVLASILTKGNNLPVTAANEISSVLSEVLNLPRPTGVISAIESDIIGSAQTLVRDVVSEVSLIQPALSAVASDLVPAIETEVAAAESIVSVAQDQLQSTALPGSIVSAVVEAARTLIEDSDSIKTQLQSVPSAIISNITPAVETALGGINTVLSGLENFAQPTGGAIGNFLPGFDAPILPAASSTVQASVTNNPTASTSIAVLPTNKSCTSDLECSGLNGQLCLKVFNLVSVDTGICVDSTDPRLLQATLAASVLPVTLDASVAIGLPSSIASPIISEVGDSAQTLVRDVSSVLSEVQKLPEPTGLISTILTDTNGIVHTLVGDASTVVSDLLDFARPTSLTLPVSIDSQPLESALGNILPGLADTPLASTSILGSNSVTQAPSGLTSLVSVPTGRSCSTDADCSGLGAKICFKALNLVAGQTGVCVDSTDPQLIGLSLTASILPASVDVSLSLAQPTAVVLPVVSAVESAAETILDSVSSVLNGNPGPSATQAFPTVVSSVNGIAQTLIKDVSPAVSELPNIVTLPTGFNTPLGPAVSQAAQSLLDDTSSIVTNLGDPPLQSNVPNLLSDANEVAQTLIVNGPTVVSGILPQPTGIVVATIGDIGGVVSKVGAEVSSVLPEVVNPEVTQIVAGVISDTGNLLTSGLPGLIKGVTTFLPVFGNGQGSTTAASASQTVNEPVFVPPTPIAPVPITDALSTSSTSLPTSSPTLVVPSGAKHCTEPSDCYDTNSAGVGLCLHIGAYIGLKANVGICAGLGLSNDGVSVGLDDNASIGLATAVPTQAAVSAEAVFSAPLVDTVLAGVTSVATAAPTAVNNVLSLVSSNIVDPVATNVVQPIASGIIDPVTSVVASDIVAPVVSAVSGTADTVVGGAVNLVGGSAGGLLGGAPAASAPSTLTTLTRPATTPSATTAPTTITAPITTTTPTTPSTTTTTSNTIIAVSAAASVPVKLGIGQLCSTSSECATGLHCSGGLLGAAKTCST